MEREGGREGEVECSAPREHAVLDGVVVHLCACVCMCVYAWGVWCAPLALAGGPTQQGLCG